MAPDAISTKPSPADTAAWVAARADVGAATGTHPAGSVGVPRGWFALAMGAASVMGIGLAWVMAGMGAGGSGVEPGYAAAIIALSCVTFVAPVLLATKPMGFGVVVVASSVARNMLIMTLLLAVVTLARRGGAADAEAVAGQAAATLERTGLDRPALLRGVLAGAALLLIAETAAAIGIISWLERRRAFWTGSAQAGGRGAGGGGAGGGTNSASGGQV